MSKAETVADAINRVVKQTELLSYAAELLKQFGSLENAIAEKEKLAEVAANSLNQLQTERDAFEKAVEAEKSSVLEELKAAKAEAKDIVAKAKEKAKTLDDQAEEIYAAKVAEANSAAVAQVTDYESKLKALREVISEKEMHIGSLELVINEKSKEAAELDAKLEKIRANIAKLAAA